MTTAEFPLGAALFDGLPRERASLLSGLHRLMQGEGFISWPGLNALANYLRVPAVEVHAAAATYNELRFTPAPVGLRRICTGLACRLRGADALLAAAQADDLPVEEVACLFACGVAPLIELGEADIVRGTLPVMRGRAVRELLARRASPPDTVHSPPARGAPARSIDSGSPAPVAAQAVTARPVLLVGGGSCGAAVGAEGLVRALRSAAADRAAVVLTGCDGACWAAPSVQVREADGSLRLLATSATADDIPAILSRLDDHVLAARNDERARWLAGQERRLLARCGVIDPDSLDEYRAANGYLALDRARRELTQQQVQALVADSGLLGRGGAYFPVARKWQTAVDAPGEVYLVANLEEGEPGVFKDRHLCEGDPHAVLEGMLIAAYALKAARLYVYINGQADLAARRIERALDQARAAGYLPNGPSELRVELLRGAGGYVCGEESVLLNSIEGERAVPRLRPPFPAESGLWEHPTVVNNAETFANLPMIVRDGAAWFRTAGTERAPGTKLLCLAGTVAHPGLVEVPFGTPLRRIVFDLAGADPAETVGLVAGGPSGGLLPAAMLDLPLQPGVLDGAGAMLGAGGLTVFDDTLAPLEIARHLTAYNAVESCGKCTPCREGAARLERQIASAAVLDAAVDVRTVTTELMEVIRLASLCGLGQAATGPASSLMAHFPHGTAAGERTGPPPPAIAPATPAQAGPPRG